MNKAGFSIILAFLLQFSVFSATEINYEHRSLKRELSKAGIKEMEFVEEVVLPDSILPDQVFNGKYFLINAENKAGYKYLYVGRVNSCRTGGCSIKNRAESRANSEYFDYYILYDQDKTVRRVKVFNYQATHGYEISAKGWLKQFIGHNANNELLVDKHIDTISGATISVHAITKDIKIKTTLLKNILP